MVDRRYGPFFVATFVAGSGNWLHVITSGIVVFALTGSSLAVGAVGIAQFGSFLLVTPLAGELADRVDRRTVLIASYSTAALASAALAAITWSIGPQVPIIIGVTVLLGLGHAISIPSVLAIVPNIVSHNELSAGVALNTVAVNLARVVGPVLGAFVYASAGAAAAFALNAIFHTPMILVLAFVIPRTLRPQSQQRAQLSEAIRAAKEDRGLVLAFVGVVAMGYALDPITTLSPSAAAAIGRTDNFVGLIVSAFGGGAILAVTLATMLRRRFGPFLTGAVGLIMMGVSLIGWSVADSPSVVLVMLVCAGAGYITSVTDITSAIQERSPDELRGRMMALWSAALLGPRPVAAAINGWTADTVGIRSALILAGLVPIAAGVVIIARRRTIPA
jgi:MFS family permease